MTSIKRVTMKLSKKIKLELYNLLNKEANAFGDNGDDGIIPFLSDIWDLSSMKSEDNRYNNALGDFIQHLIRNDDYSYDYVFQERLKLLDDDEKFSLFIETVLQPKYRDGEDDIFKYVLLINPYLEKEGYTLILQDYDSDGYPLYKLGVIPKENIPTDIKPNDINFYVEKNPSGRSDRVRSHTKPQIFPSFVLVYDSWDDFSVKSTYHLFYYDSENENPVSIGGVKIIYQNESKTNEYLPDNFKLLSDDFCSLGQEEEYYNELRNTLKKRFDSVLYALKDAAFYPDIQDKFERNGNFKESLIRFDEAERLLREARYRIYDYDLSNLYSFKYQFKPAFSKDSVDINFEFSSNDFIPYRIYALIGKNGTGKTQLITSLPLMISEKKSIFLLLKHLFLVKLLLFHIVFLIDSKFPKRQAVLIIIIVELEKTKTNNSQKKD